MPTVSSRMSEDVLLDDPIRTQQEPIISEKILPSEGNQLTDSTEGRGALKEFVEQLDAKLKHLQNQDAKDLQNRKKFPIKIAGEIVKRPLFITTVPTGYYVQPCKEPPCIRKVYSYYSQPRVVASPDKSRNKAQKNSRPALDLKRHVIAEPVARKEVLRDSNQPYQNMMFDKRVIRGSNF
uniref:Uncharacterized protein n=1 Tax=Lutzomyia longipalpis TaxID=7200 RepID=A0A1B0CMC2_LUTLO